MKTLLRIENVSSGYGSITIIHDISISVADKEIVTMIGPNGSGKSTLLKTIFGLVKPTKGEVYFDGERISGLRSYEIARRRLSYVPQLQNVFSTMTVKENLEMGAYSLRGGYTDVFDDALQTFPILREKADERVKNLSGGERQMLAMATALMSKPQLLLLDEPTASLAPMAAAEVLQKVKAIRKKGASVLVVEQNARKSLEISDRGYVLVMGRKVMEGTAAEILDQQSIARLYLGKK